MKIKIAMLFIATVGFLQSFAQEANQLTNDLVKDKRTILAKHIPMYKGDYLHIFYVMPADELLSRLGKFKSEMYQQAEAEKDTALRSLMIKDINYYAGQVLDTYMSLYGMDSLGMIQLEETMKRRSEPNYKELMKAAEKKAFVRTLDTAEIKRLTGIINENTTLNDEALFRRSASYRSWLNNRVNEIRMQKFKTNPKWEFGDVAIVNLQTVKEEIPAGFVQDQMNYKITVEILKMAKDSTAKDKAYTDFMASAKNEKQRKEVQTIYENFKMMSSNAIAPNFEFPDVNGKMVSLSALKGKYVYIDVWATWCAPCKVEIPFLQKIEHDYAGKNIHFVSLSVDRMTSKKTWENYVKENKLGGIQVMADKDFSSDFIKKFNISSIPRFLLIDPTGKIVSGDAKRPSDPELRAQLDKLLK